MKHDSLVFVFGSNLAGRHGAGAARFAMIHRGAVYGRGFGHHGNSYALPTKDRQIRTLSNEAIRQFVSLFVSYAETNPSLSFQVTRIGCGLAGMSDPLMARMFLKAPQNCFFDSAWQPHLGESFEYWGSFE